MCACARSCRLCSSYFEGFAHAQATAAFTSVLKVGLQLEDTARNEQRDGVDGLALQALQDKVCSS